MAVRYRRERLDRGIKARCEDIFALSSYREALYLVLPRAIPVVGLFIAPLIIGGYWEKVLIYACIYGLLALSWDFLALAGMVSLGQAFFFGAGAYSAGVLNYYFGWPPFITIPLGTLIGALFCTAFLSTILRLRGVYFAIVTFILPMLCARVIDVTYVFGGMHGLSSLALLSSNKWVTIYIPIVILLICLFGFRRLINEDYGLVLRGIRDNDRAVMRGAINMYWYKTQALFIAGVVGAFAGAFFTHYYQFVGPSAFAFDYSIIPLTGAVLGGIGTFAGPVLGSFIVVPLSEILRAEGALRIVVYCIILIVCIVGLPEGVFHYIQRKYQQFERFVEVR